MRATDGKCKLMRSNQTWLRKNAFHRTKQKRCLNVYIHVLIHYVSTPLHITLRPSTLCQYTSPYTITLRPNTLSVHLSTLHYVSIQSVSTYTSPYTITLHPNTLCQYTSSHYITPQYTLSVHLSLYHYITSQYILSLHLSTVHYLPIHSVSTYTSPYTITLRPTTVCQSTFFFFFDNIFHLDVHYVCMLVQRFEPQGRRFTNFHYYYYYTILSVQ